VNELNICPACGAKLSSRTLEGFCPSCTARFTFDVSANASSSAASVIGLHFGNYELLHEVGRGGMGVIYKARQRSLNRVVALKMILSGRFAGAESVERLRAEATAAAVLQHPNIVAIHEIGEVEGQHYFTMDYVAGCNLAEMVRERPVSAHRAAAWVRTIAEAIERAHRHGVLHRDLKPSNVLIDEHDQPRITDFGLARRFVVPPPCSAKALRGGESSGPADTEPAKAGTTNLTLSGHPVGSPGYMPPEQALGKRSDIGPHSDVYAMGALLYHLLTGRAPFSAETMEATLSQALHNEPAPPRTLNPTVPRDLETICLKCLEKEPARRYRTAQELADDLNRFENDEPISARPVTGSERLRRWAWRNPRVAMLTVTLITVFLAGLLAVSWQWRRAEHHARTETQQRVRLEQVLAHKDIETAEGLFASGDVPSALARLAHVLRQMPTNHIAATRLLSALTHRSFALPVAPPLTHEAGVLSAQFSPDGRRVVTASADGTAGVWDAHTGAKLAEVRHAAIVRHAEFSPDGRRIITASEDSTAQVWDANTGQPLTAPLQHGLKVRRAHFSPDGQRVVTASADATARVWDGRTGEPVAPPLQHAKYVNDAAFSPDGRRVATASDDATACVWDARTGMRLVGPLQHREQIYSARFSPEEKRLVTASADGTARVWDALTGQPLAVLRHREFMPFANFSPDGTRVVTASWDNTARVWDAATGEPVTPALEFESDVLHAEFSSDGRRVFAIADTAARVWDAASGRPLTELILHAAPLRHVGGFSPDGGRVVTASLDKTAIVRDVRAGAALPEILADRQASRTVAGSADGRWIAAGRGREFVVHVWDASTGEIVAGPLHHDDLIVTIQFSPDGRSLLTASRDGTARIWNVPSGEPAGPPLRHQGPIRSAQFSRDGRRIATASEDETARIRDAASGRELFAPLRHGNYVSWAEFSPDDQRVVTASGDNTARVWDAATGQPLVPPLRHQLGLQAAHFSPDGRTLVTASDDGTARLWESGTGQPVGQPLTHLGHVRAVKFSPDGRWVVTASLDKTARVWDARTGEPVTEPLKHPASLHDARFSPDSQRVVTVDLEPVSLIRDAATGHPLFEPLRHEAKVEAVLFLSHGSRLATVGGDRLLRLWDVPSLPMPAPDWLSDLAEAVAGKRFDAQGRSIPVNAGRLVELRRQLGASDATEFYAQWARWFFADRDTRAISPFSRITMPEHARRE